MFRLFAVLTLVFAVFAAPAAAATRAERADRTLDRSLRQVVGMKGGPPGAISIVQRSRYALVHSAGVASFKSRRQPLGTDRMRVASVAKAFSGATALSLVEQGKLRLDDTIGKLLPDLPVAWHSVNLAQALQHTSGLADFSASKSFATALVADLHGTPSPRQLLSYVSGEPLKFAPGSRYEYSNTDNVVAALMVAAVSGRSYEQALQTQVARPLRLQRTFLPIGFELAAPSVHGYDISGSKPEDVTTTISAAWSYASGGVVSTAADLNRFVRGYVGRKLFSSGLQKQQLALVAGHSEPPGPGRNSAGLAIFRYQTRCGTVYGHTGNTLGYTQFIAASRNGQRSATVSINGQLTQLDKGSKAKIFKSLRRVYLRAVCAALA